MSLPFRNPSLCNNALVRGKHDQRSTTKTRQPREFPIEDPALESLLKKLWAPDKKPDAFVFQEPDGKHINRRNFYNSWHGCQNKYTLRDGTERTYSPKGIVTELAALGEEKGGIDHYRPQYNTRHTFISLAIEGMTDLSDSTMQDIVTLSDYVGNSADVILEHYLGRSEKRKIVIISRFRKEAQASESNGKIAQIQPLQAEQVLELEQQNSRLQSCLQSLAQFIQAVLIQFVPEALRSQLSEFVTTLVKNQLPYPVSNESQLTEELDEEIAKCAVWLSIEHHADG